MRSKDRVKRRRKKLRVLPFLALIVIVMLVFFIWRVRTELKEVQQRLEKYELMSYEGTETEKSEVIEQIEPVSGITTIYVGKPIRRTMDETVNRLRELGADSPVILEIYRNRALYTEDMLAALANNPEMAEFVLGYLKDEVPAGGLTSEEKEQEYPLFLQWDPRWGYQSYGRESCIGLAGCGPTCMSMVLYYLTGDEELTPDKLADYAIDNGYYVEGTGTDWAYMEDVPALYGIHVKEVSLSEQAMKAELDKGSVIICAMRAGDFTLSGHFIVIYGYDEGGFQVNDPNCVARSRQSWSFEQIQGQIKKIWTYGE